MPAAELTPEQFDALFDRATSTVFRLETLQSYTVGGEEAERLNAFRKGLPRPERSVRTSPWLARIATTTTINGRTWTRVHIVDHPLSGYLQHELLSYIESQAVGEQVHIADRATHPDLNTLREDFWLFDADTTQPSAAALRYNDGGEWLGADYTTDPHTIDSMRASRDLALTHAMPLNTYLAGHRNAGAA